MIVLPCVRIGTSVIISFRASSITIVQLTFVLDVNGRVEPSTKTLFLKMPIRSPAVADEPLLIEKLTRYVPGVVMVIDVVFIIN